MSSATKQVVTIYSLILEYFVKELLAAYIALGAILKYALS